VSNTASFYGTFEGAHHRLLSDNGVEGAGAPLAVERNVAHLEGNCSENSHIASIAEASARETIKNKKLKANG
jgi:hypothetical protein